MTIELNDRLHELEKWESQDVPILSLYLNLSPSIEERKTIGARLRNLLEPIGAQESGLDHEGRMSLRASIQRLLALEPEIAGNTGKCVAVFVGGRPELDEFLTLPRKAWDIAVAATHPYLRPFLAALDHFHRIATVLVDPRRSTINVTYMGEPLDAVAIESPPVRKSDYAGWQGLEEHRVRQHTEEVHHRHYRQVTDELARLRQGHGLDVVFVGGREESVAALLRVLPPPLAALVADTFTVDLHTATPGQTARLTAELEDRYGEREERQLVEEVMELARSGSLGCYGLASTLHAANLGAVDLLLVAGAHMVPGFQCDNCGWLSLAGPICIGCGEEANAASDLIEPLAMRVRHTGARVEHVMVPSGLDGEPVAARLRFPLPVPPARSH